MGQIIIKYELIKLIRLHTSSLTLQATLRNKNNSITGTTSQVISTPKAPSKRQNVGDLSRNEIEQASNTQLTSSTTTANSTPNGKRQRHDLSINQGKVV